MTRDYRPRRCSRRWLDGDCPSGVLAIIDNPGELDRYTVFYADTQSDGRDVWVTYLGTSADLSFSGHGEMRAHEVAAYRYRNAHRYIRWSDLPTKVRNHVRRVLADESAAS